MNNPNAKPPNIDSFFFTVVSLELILLSIEQSLRLLLLLHYRVVRDDTNHAHSVLYKAMLNNIGGKETGIRADVVAHANVIGSQMDIPPTTEKEIVTCLERHNASYSNFRYFQLSREGKLNPKFQLKGRETQVLHTLAIALISLNIKEMNDRKIGMYQSMSVVPDSEITDDLRALGDATMEGTNSNAHSEP